MVSKSRTFAKRQYRHKHQRSPLSPVTLGRRRGLRDTPARRLRIYSPLDDSKREFRLVRLAAGSDNDVPTGELFVSSVPVPPDTQVAAIPETAQTADQAQTEHTRYETISYTWGAPTRKQCMIINGSDFYMPASAVEVLKALRSPHRPVVFWIDAVCINQIDLAEKSTQVAMMGDIHRGSSKTHVWLGQTTELTDSAVKFCRKLKTAVLSKLDVKWQRVLAHWDSTRLQLGRTEYKDFECLSQVVLAAIKSTAAQEFGDPRILLDIFRRPWFRRLWVFQEVILAQTSIAHIGDLLCPWLDVLIAASWVQKLPEGGWRNEIWGAVSIAVQQLVTRLSKFWSGGHYQMSNIVLSTDRRVLVSVPHDRIFALLPLINWNANGWESPIVIRPYYAMSVRDCMCFATNAMIQNDGDLRVLANTCLLLEGGNGVTVDDDSWPSWTPVWHFNLPVTAFRWYQLKPMLYSADDVYMAYRYPIRSVLYLGTYALILDGLTVGVVSAISPTMHMRSPWDEEYSALRQWASEHGIFNAELWMAMSAGRYGDLRFTIDDKEVDQLYRRKTFHITVQEAPRMARGRDEVDYTVLPKPRYIEGDRRTVVTSMKWSPTSRRLCTIESIAGRYIVGLSPRNTEQGDVAVVLFGSPMPWILRPKNGKWLMIGPCYLHGIVDSEFVRKWSNVKGIAY